MWAGLLKENVNNVVSYMERMPLHNDRIIEIIKKLPRWHPGAISYKHAALVV